jgi:hypothetical protein
VGDCKPRLFDKDRRRSKVCDHRHIRELFPFLQTIGLVGWLVSLATLVHQLGSEVARYYHIFIPVIAYSTNIENDESLYLLDDGLELWCALIKAAPASDRNHELLALFPNLLAICKRYRERERERERLYC